MRAALRNGPVFLLANLMWLAWVGAAWGLGLLDGLTIVTRPEAFLLLTVLGVFLAAQGAALLGRTAAADAISGFMPQLGMVFLTMVVTSGAAHTDFSTPASVLPLVRTLLHSVILTGSAVLGLTWCEAVLRVVSWSRGGGGR